MREFKGTPVTITENVKYKVNYIGDSIERDDPCANRVLFCKICDKVFFRWEPLSAYKDESGFVCALCEEKEPSGIAR